MRNSLKKCSALVLLLTILVSASAVSAQDLTSRPRIVAAQVTRPRTVTVPEALIVEAEKVAAERDHLRTVVALKDDQIKAQAEQIGALNGLAEIQRMRAEAWATAATERKSAIVIDDKRIALFEVDVLRLRTERDKARSAQKSWGAVGLILGIALGVFSQRGK